MNHVPTPVHGTLSAEMRLKRAKASLLLSALERKENPPWRYHATKGSAWSVSRAGCSNRLHELHIAIVRGEVFDVGQDRFQLAVAQPKPRAQRVAQLIGGSGRHQSTTAQVDQAVGAKGGRVTVVFFSVDRTGSTLNEMHATPSVVAAVVVLVDGATKV